MKSTFTRSGRQMLLYLMLRSATIVAAYFYTGYTLDKRFTYVESHNTLNRHFIAVFCLTFTYFQLLIIFIGHTEIIVNSASNYANIYMNSRADE